MQEFEWVSRVPEREARLEVDRGLALGAFCKECGSLMACDRVKAAAEGD